MSPYLMQKGLNYFFKFFVRPHVVVGKYLELLYGKPILNQIPVL